MLKRHFDSEKPQDCSKSSAYGDAVADCPYSTNQVGVIPFVFDEFYPYRTFMDVDQYNGLITVPQTKLICDFLNKEIAPYPEVPFNMFIFVIGIVAMSVTPVLGLLCMIFSPIVGLLIIVLGLSISIPIFVVHTCNICKKNDENRKKRKSILPRKVDELNYYHFMEELFTVRISSDIKYLQIEFAVAMGELPPNRARYANGLPKYNKVMEGVIEGYGMPSKPGKGAISGYGMPARPGQGAISGYGMPARPGQGSIMSGRMQQYPSVGGPGNPPGYPPQRPPQPSGYYAQPHQAYPLKGPQQGMRSGAPMMQGPQHQQRPLAPPPRRGTGPQPNQVAPMRA